MKKNKRGQITIFIIIAVVIVVVGILAVLFYPDIKTTFEAKPINPAEIIQTCVEEDIQENIDKLSLQGGSLNPEHYMLYGGEKLEYLCYINEYFKTCVMQQPLLKQHIESEIKKDAEGKIKACFDLMKTDLEEEYTIELKEGGVDVEILPKKIVVAPHYVLTLTKESTERYDKFNIVLNNNIYELVSIANSILNWEARYGDAETTVYMNYYHNLKVEKKKQTDGSTVYILTDNDTKDKFQFAVRSLAYPAGYGMAETFGK